MLPLAAYRSLVHLDEPFVQPPRAPLQDSLPLVNRLLTQLLEQDGRSTRIPRGITPRQALYAALISRPPLPLRPGILEELDALLAAEASARGAVVADELPRCDTWAGREDIVTRSCALFRGDITLLKVDAIVNAANSAMLGCFQPFHSCIDNCIHAAAGPRLRADCQRLMDLQGCAEAPGGAKLTRAYHLPARYILHTVGPIFSGSRSDVPLAESELLASCYRACLDLAAILPSIRSLAFCCVSTGVFGFPAQAAAGIAIQTVSRWVKEHPGRFELLVFDVFSEQDENIYRSLLNRSEA